MRIFLQVHLPGVRKIKWFDNTLLSLISNFNTLIIFLNTRFSAAPSLRIVKSLWNSYADYASVLQYAKTPTCGRLVKLVNTRVDSCRLRESPLVKEAMQLF